MSIPNPPRRRRYHYRRYSDERIWREFMAGCLARQTPDVAALQADKAYAEYRDRFPVREPELDDEPASLEGDQFQPSEGLQNFINRVKNIVPGKKDTQ
jgi:hypothetical protein